MALRTAESGVRSKIRKYLAGFENVYQFWPVQKGYGRRTVDLLACVDGVFFAVEVKDTGKTPTALQYDTLCEVSSAKGSSFWCDSWESFSEQFRVHCSERGVRLIPKVTPARKSVRS